MRAVTRLLKTHRVVALLGARQVGKNTHAREIVAARSGTTTVFDLEDPRDLARLADPMLALAPLTGLVVLDEIQRRPDLFPALRVLADRPRGPRFLAIGSASGVLLRQSSESLAGRIACYELPPFGLDVTVQTINAIENNRYGPSYMLGARIADYFGVHPHEVFILDAEDRKKKEPK